jgi:hypothetical protein
MSGLYTHSNKSNACKIRNYTEIKITDLEAHPGIGKTWN